MIICCCTVWFPAVVVVVCKKNSEVRSNFYNLHRVMRCGDEIQ